MYLFTKKNSDEIVRYPRCIPERDGAWRGASEVEDLSKLGKLGTKMRTVHRRLVRLVVDEHAHDPTLEAVARGVKPGAGPKKRLRGGVDDGVVATAFSYLIEMLL